MRQSAFFFLLLLFCSCSFFLKKIGGIKNPEIESYASINKYSKKLNIDSSMIVFAKDSISQNKLNSIFQSTPEMLLFNNLKKFIPYKNDSTNCNASIDSILENICIMNTSNLTSTRKINYDTLISLIADPNKCGIPNTIRNIDYIVFMNYTKYAYRVNKTHFIPWNKTIKETWKNCSVKYVYVNLDYLDTWNIKKSSLPRIKITTRR